jgi:hypothetical protein
VGIIAITPTALQDLAGHLKDAFVSDYASEDFTDSVFFFGTKLAIIDAAGHYVAPPTESVYDLAAPYGTGTAYKPFQVALVGTLRHIGIGRGNFGRIYLPPVQVNPGQNGHIPDVSTGIFADNLQAFIGDVNDWVNTVTGTGAKVSIFSRTAATAKTVDTVGVGSVLDTQRRRRDQLIESIEYRDL